MPLGEWLVLVGGGCLALGLGLAFWSSRQDVKAFGEHARYGQTTLAEDEGSSVLTQRQTARRRAERAFVGGLTLTLLGVVLQTLGSLLS